MRRRFHEHSSRLLFVPPPGAGAVALYRERVASTSRAWLADWVRGRRCRMSRIQGSKHSDDIPLWIPELPGVRESSFWITLLDYKKVWPLFVPPCAVLPGLLPVIRVWHPTAGRNLRSFTSISLEITYCEQGGDITQSYASDDGPLLSQWSIRDASARG